ncbi:hypothetical protein, partial [Methyloversatilis sp.]|uniref:hypothetical protein n=1 Tax=Methyloversatilis sp. TaxID=2569862 RepID=UPI0027340604
LLGIQPDQRQRHDFMPDATQRLQRFHHPDQGIVFTATLRIDDFDTVRKRPTDTVLTVRV